MKEKTSCGMKDRNKSYDPHTVLSYTCTFATPLYLSDRSILVARGITIFVRILDQHNRAVDTADRCTVLDNKRPNKI